MTRIAWLLFLALAVIHTWPLARVLPTHASDFNDAILNIWQLGAIAQQLAKDPLHPFDVNTFYPYKAALALFDPQLASGILAAPLTLVSGNPVLGHNVFIFASFVLCGVTMFLLVRELTGSGAAGLIAGCVYAFAPFRTGRLSHAHMLTGFWLPLLLLWIHRYAAEPRWSRIAVVAGLFVIHAYSSLYFAAIAMVSAAVVGTGALLGRAHLRTALARSLVGAAIVFAALLPLALQFPRVKAWETAGRSERQTEPGPAEQLENVLRPQLSLAIAQTLSSEVQHYVAVGRKSHLWRPLGDLGTVEGSYFPGALALALAAIGYVTLRSRDGRGMGRAFALVAAIPASAVVCAALGRTSAWPILLTRRFSLVIVLLAVAIAGCLWRARQHTADASRRALWIYLALMAAGVMFSFGTQVRAFGVDLGRGMYPAAIPPFGVLRVPARFGVIYTVGLVVVAGFGVAWIERRVSGRLRLALLAVALLVVNAEQFAAPLDFGRLPRVTAADTWLRHADPGPVIVFPTNNNPWTIINALHHRQPLINGSGMIPPPPFPRLTTFDDLSPAMIEHLRTYFHPRYAVVHLDFYTSETRPDIDQIIENGRRDFRQVAQMGNSWVFEFLPGAYGSRIKRQYQPWMLEGKSGVAFRGSVEADRPGLELAVTASVDGRVVTRWTHETFPPGILQFVPFPTPLTQEPTVELAAEYTIPPAAWPPIGATGRVSPADVAVSASADRTFVTVNAQMWSGSKGYTLIELHDDGTRRVHRFNTSWYAEDSKRLAEYVRGLAAGQVVAVASHYDVSKQLTADAVEALRSLGFREDLRGRANQSHGGVGVKGAAPGTAIECAGHGTVRCGVGTPARVVLNLSDLRLY